MATLKCPRCQGTEMTGADSPIKGAWELYTCNSCCFVWRSTEKDLAPLKVPANTYINPPPPKGMEVKRQVLEFWKKVGEKSSRAC